MAEIHELFARRVRLTGIDNWKPQMQATDWHYNTHHLNYQVTLRRGAFRVFPANLIEMNPTQFENWLRDLQEAREIIQNSLPPS